MTLLTLLRSMTMPDRRLPWAWLPMIQLSLTSREMMMPCFWRMPLAVLPAMIRRRERSCGSMPYTMFSR